jgi:hypothetical protein
MDDELVITENNLLNIVNWLRLGHVVCLHHTYRCAQFYHSVGNVDKFDTKAAVIYIDLKRWSALLDEDEWPSNILEEGFVPYESTHILPKKEYHFDLP